MKTTTLARIIGNVSVTVLAVSLLLSAAPQTPLQILQPEQSATDRDFGDNVAIDQGFLGVGDPFFPGYPTNNGRVYLYQQTTTGYEQVQAIDAPSGSSWPGGNFGRDLAIGNGFLVIGQREYFTAQQGPGKVFIYPLGASSQPSQILEGEATGIGLGFSLDISGDWMAVGAVGYPGASFSASAKGAVYLYELVGGQWIERQRLLSPMPTIQGQFGVDVDLEGDLLAVGANRDEHGQSFVGAVYTFRHNPLDGLWDHEQTLLPTLGQQGNATDLSFGLTVSMDGGNLAVGCGILNSQSTNTGRCFVFEEQAGAWSQIAELEAWDGNTDVRFGEYVSVDGDNLLVASDGDNIKFNDAGSAYLYRRQAGTWLPVSKLLSATPVEGGNYGRSIAMEGGVAVIGECGFGTSTNFSGQVHVVDLAPCPQTPGALRLALAGSPGSPASLGVTASGSGRLPMTLCGPDHAGALYFVLGSTSGTTPSLVVDGVSLPLNFIDPYFFYTLSYPNNGVLQQTFGFLDAQGQAACALQLPSSPVPAAVGLTLHHAALAIDPVSLAAKAASNALGALLLM